jgi:hypothetical protein
MRRPVGVPYRLTDVKHVWRRNHGLGRQSLAVYEYWLYRFARYCERYSLDQRTELTQCGAERFARWWQLHGSCRHGRIEVATAASHGPLRAWAFALSMLGEPMPPWSPPTGCATCLASQFHWTRLTRFCERPNRGVSAMPVGIVAISHSLCKAGAKHLVVPVYPVGARGKSRGHAVGNRDVVHGVSTRPAGLAPLRRTRPQVHRPVHLRPPACARHPAPALRRASCALPLPNPASVAR